MKNIMSDFQNNLKTPSYITRIQRDYSPILPRMYKKWYRFSQNVQEFTILLNFQIHCVQNVENYFVYVYLCLPDSVE